MLALFAFSLFVPRLLSNAIAVVVPVPDRATECGLPDASSAICRLALRAPAAVGANLTLIVQLAPAANVAGLSAQVVLCEKSPVFVPARPMLAIDRAAVPVFMTFTV